jgi:hypothetical protein
MLRHTRVCHSAIVTNFTLTQNLLLLHKLNFDWLKILSTEILSSSFSRCNDRDLVLLLYGIVQEEDEKNRLTNKTKRELET